MYACFTPKNALLVVRFDSFSDPTEGKLLSALLQLEMLLLVTENVLDVCIKLISDCVEYKYPSMTIFGHTLELKSKEMSVWSSHDDPVQHSLVSSKVDINPLQVNFVTPVKLIGSDPLTSIVALFETNGISSKINIYFILFSSR